MTLSVKEYKPQHGDGSHGGPRFVKELYEFISPKSLVLDCGAGLGFKTEYMIFKGLEVVSLDVDMASLKNLRDNRKSAYLVCGDAQHLPFKSEVFSSVVASEILEHLPDPELCINDIHRVMKKNAIAVFTTPVFNLHLQFFVHIFRIICGIEADNSHLHVFSTNQLRNYLSEVFTIKNIVHRGFTELFVVKFGFDKNGTFDKKLIKISQSFKLINLFATKIWILTKKEDFYKS